MTVSSQPAAAPRAAPSSTPPEQAPPTRVRVAVLGVLLAMLLGMLDTAIVGTAMPTIVGDLGGSAHLSWVVTAYTLAMAVSTPVWGKLGDLRGRKGVFLASIVVFLAGSAASGAAHSMGQLIAFRGLQGVGAGGLGVGAFALIGALVPPRERGRYQGMTASLMAVGTIGGPLVGGFVTTHAGWRWAFYLNLPLGVLAFVWCLLALHVPAKRVAARIDWAGAVLLGVSITSLLLVTTWGGQQYAWTSAPVLALASSAVLTLVAFLQVQRHVAEPILPLRLFTSRNLPLAMVVIAVVGVVMFGCVLYLPLYQQSVQHADASSSGLLLLPMMVPLIVVSQVAGRVMSATGRYKVFPVIGAALLVTGMALLATMDTTTSRVTTSVFMVLIGAGLGATTQMATTIAQNSVALTDLGAASGAANLFRTLGGSLGIAVFGALYTRATGTAAHGAAHLQAVTHGTQHLFATGAVIAVAALAAALAIQEVPLRPGPAAPPAGDAATAAARR